MAFSPDRRLRAAWCRCSNGSYINYHFGPSRGGAVLADARATRRYAPWPARALGFAGAAQKKRPARGGPNQYLCHVFIGRTIARRVMLRRWSGALNPPAGQFLDARRAIPRSPGRVPCGRSSRWRNCDSTIFSSRTKSSLLVAAGVGFQQFGDFGEGEAEMLALEDHLQADFLGRSRRSARRRVRIGVQQARAAHKSAGRASVPYAVDPRNVRRSSSKFRRLRFSGSKAGVLT